MTKIKPYFSSSTIYQLNKAIPCGAHSVASCICHFSGDEGVIAKSLGALSSRVPFKPPSSACFGFPFRHMLPKLQFSFLCQGSCALNCRAHGLCMRWPSYRDIAWWLKLMPSGLVLRFFPHDSEAIYGLCCTIDRCALI